MKKYYAAYNPYGIHTAFGDYNVPVLHVFFSKAERDAWVDDDPNLMCQTISAATYRKWEKVCEERDLIVVH